MIEVELPDGRIAEFPDDMSHADMLKAIQGLDAPASAPDPSIPQPGPAVPAPGSDRTAITGDSFTTEKVGRIGGAIAQGYREAQIPPEEVQRAGPVGRAAAAVINPLMGGANAIYRGLQQTGVETLTPLVGDRGARDIVSIPDAFVGSPGALRQPPVGVPVNRLGFPERPPPEPPRGPTGAPIVRTDIAADPTTGPVAPPAGRAAAIDEVRRADQGLPSEAPEPVGGSVGAAANNAPQGPISTTERQVRFEQSVLQTAADRAIAQGGEDHTPYVPNTQRTEAARVLTPEAAVHERVLRDTDPTFDARVRKIEGESAETLLDEFRKQAGDANALEALKDERRAFSPDNLRVFDTEQPVDASGIIQAIDDALAGRDGRRPKVRAVLEDVRKSFLDADGNPEAWPSMLYGGRLNITDVLDGARGTGDGAAAARASRAILTRLLEQVVDPTIQQGAPKFGEFRREWSTRSRAIDRMEFLQGKLLSGAGDVRGANGRLQYQAFQRMLEKMAADMRKSDNNPAKAFDLEHLDPLIAIRNELAAWHYRDQLYNTAGSPTVQRATMAARLQTPGVGEALATVGRVGDVLTGGVAGAAKRILLDPAIQRSRTAKLNAVKDRMAQTAPPPNALMGP